MECRLPNHRYSLFSPPILLPQARAAGELLPWPGPLTVSKPDLSQTKPRAADVPAFSFNLSEPLRKEMAFMPPPKSPATLVREFIANQPRREPPNPALSLPAGQFEELRREIQAGIADVRKGAEKDRDET